MCNVVLVCVCVGSHLTKLEGEATTMKDVLTNLQTTMDLEQDGESNLVDITSAYPDFQTPPPKLTPATRDDNDRDLDQNSNSSNGKVSAG